MRDGEERRQVQLQLLEAQVRETFGLLGFDARPHRISYRRGWQNRVMQVVQLTKVFRDTSAERLGLRAGDIIVAVRTQTRDADDGWVPVRSLAELVSLVRGPDFRLDDENIWILRDQESFKGRLVFDDPDLAERYHEG